MKISIPQPCHENWNEMTSQEKGRFCSVCEKCVVDFSQMKDDQILNYLAQTKVCGRITYHQLDRINQKLTTHYQFSIPSIFKYSTLITLLSTPNFLFSQEKEIIEIVDKKDVSELESSEIDYFIFKSQVVDADYFPIQNAYINVKDTNIVEFTDEQGWFSIKIPKTIENPKLFIYDYSTDLDSEFEVNKVKDQIVIKTYPELELMIMGLLIKKRTVAGKVIHTMGYPFRKIGKLFDSN